MCRFIQPFYRGVLINIDHQLGNSMCAKMAYVLSDVRMENKADIDDLFFFLGSLVILISQG